MTALELARGIEALNRVIHAAPGPDGTALIQVEHQELRDLAELLGALLNCDVSLASRSRR